MATTWNEKAAIIVWASITADDPQFLLHLPAHGQAYYDDLEIPIERVVDVDKARGD
jgi:hypothetical protein